MSEFIFERITIIGLGLIGASMALAIKGNKLAREIIGTDASADVCKRAQALGLVDDVIEDIGVAVAGADLVVLAVPVGVCGAVAAQIAPRLKAGAVLTDVGSVKQAVMADVEPHVPEGVSFIPGHPIAGTEHSGPEAGFATLFSGRWVILTPPENAKQDHVQLLTELWAGMGAEIEVMKADHHDLVLAITSHVPHLIAYNIVGTVAELEADTQSEVIKFSASGFRDFTRIAASDPVMWRDVFLNNKDAVLEMLGRFSEDLTALQRAIRREDGDALYALFSRTREIRRNIIEAGQETDKPDFGREHEPD